MHADYLLFFSTCQTMSNAYGFYVYVKIIIQKILVVFPEGNISGEEIRDRLDLWNPMTLAVT